MAKFAKIGLNNEVIDIVVMSNLETMTEDGIFDEQIGIKKLKKETGHETWLLCGSNLNGTTIRKNEPSIGWFYNQECDGFYLPRPVDINNQSCDSWILNKVSCIWEPPIPRPNSYFKYEDNIHEICFIWNENLYLENNQNGWVQSI